jgi:hypothetical protein
MSVTDYSTEPYYLRIFLVVDRKLTQDEIDLRRDPNAVF